MRAVGLERGPLAWNACGGVGGLGWEQWDLGVGCVVWSRSLGSERLGWRGAKVGGSERAQVA